MWVITYINEHICRPVVQFVWNCNYVVSMVINWWLLSDCAWPGYLFDHKKTIMLTSILVISKQRKTGSVKPRKNGNFITYDSVTTSKHHIVMCKIMPRDFLIHPMILFENQCWSSSLLFVIKSNSVFVQVNRGSDHLLKGWHTDHAKHIARKFKTILFR